MPPEPRVYACHESGYVVMPLLKVASSSIIYSVNRAEPSAKWVALSRCKGLFKFAFVRNPYTRLASAWWNLVYEPPDGEVLIKDPDVELGMEFDDFMSIVPDLLDDEHLTPQADLLKDFDPDFIGSFEDINEDWEKLKDFVPELPALLHLNESKTDRAISWELCYDTRAMRTKAYNIYRKDFEEFGYDRNIDGV